MIHLRHLNDRPCNTATTEVTNASTGERQRMVEALNTTRWNRRKVATLLGMPYSTLRYKIATLNLR